MSDRVDCLSENNNEVADICISGGPHGSYHSGGDACRDSGLRITEPKLLHGSLRYLFVSL